ncbi:MAG: UspA famly universal stress protein [Rhodobacteraceae bacterium HLUCCA08]|nr:MAG: UspA famly universal stress protein [Rhodobacteraceae bacterium HLUCCA08]
MSYRTLAVIVTDQMADAAALNAAGALAARDKAHLDVFCIGIDPARYEPLPAGSAAFVLDAANDEARDRADELVTWVEAQLAGAAFPFAVQGSVVPHLGLDTAVSRLARYCDLIVAARPYGGDATQVQVSVLEAALFGTGAPILVVPPGDLDLSDPFGRPMIAWNESDECLDTVRKALPLLQAADLTDIVMVDPPAHSPERSDPGGSLCIMLGRQGVRGEVSILARSMPRVSEVLNRYAREHGSDLIVMGAYGHSRFREAILGGATREMLENAQVPVLMSH